MTATLPHPPPKHSSDLLLKKISNWKRIPKSGRVFVVTSPHSSPGRIALRRGARPAGGLHQVPRSGGRRPGHRCASGAAATHRTPFAGGDRSNRRRICPNRGASANAGRAFLGEQPPATPAAFAASTVFPWIEFISSHCKHTWARNHVTSPAVFVWLSLSFVVSLQKNTHHHHHHYSLLFWGYRRHFRVSFSIRPSVPFISVDARLSLCSPPSSQTSTGTCCCRTT